MALKIEISKTFEKVGRVNLYYSFILIKFDTRNVLAIYGKIKFHKRTFN